MFIKLTTGDHWLITKYCCYIYIYIYSMTHSLVGKHAQKSIFLPHDLNDTWLMRHCVSDCPEVWQRCDVIYDAPQRPHSTDLVYVLFTIYNMAIKNVERQGRRVGKEKKNARAAKLYIAADSLMLWLSCEIQQSITALTMALHLCLYRYIVVGVSLSCRWNEH